MSHLFTSQKLKRTMYRSRQGEARSHPGFVLPKFREYDLLMLRETTKKHICSLSDGELLEYVLTGERVYEAEAVSFAREELDRRKPSDQQLEAIRPQIVKKIAALDASGSVDISRRRRKGSVVCQCCLREVPNAYFEYRHNIGALVIRLSGSYKGYFCRDCSLRLFLKSTGICLVLGWWGIISIFVNLGFLISNFLGLLRLMMLPPPWRSPVMPQLSDQEVAEKLAPLLGTISERLSKGDAIDDIAEEIAPEAGLGAGQVWFFLQKIVHQQSSGSAENSEKTYGFPVEPLRISV